MQSERESLAKKGKKKYEHDIKKAECFWIASHSILLSTVQYFYVHPIVLMWVAVPPQKDPNPKKKDDPQWVCDTADLDSACGLELDIIWPLFRIPPF